MINLNPLRNLIFLWNVACKISYPIFYLFYIDVYLWLKKKKIGKIDCSSENCDIAIMFNVTTLVKEIALQASEKIPMSLFVYLYRITMIYDIVLFLFFFFFFFSIIFVNPKNHRQVNIISCRSQKQYQRLIILLSKSYCAHLIKRK